jgi:hypothetical protein
MIKLEKDICRLFFYGRDISRFSRVKSKRIAIFPYEKLKGDKYELISPERFKEKFPLAYKHLEANRDFLEKREAGKHRGKTFYKYSYPKSLDEFDSPKIMMRNFSKRGQITFDQDGSAYFTSNIYGITFKETNKNFSYFMLAILNSDFAWYYIKSTSAGLRGGYFQYKTKYVEPLPVPDFETSKKSIGDLVERLIDITKLLLKNGSNTELEAESDKIVFKLYGLSNSEISQIMAEISSDYSDESEIAVGDDAA